MLFKYFNFIIQSSWKSNSNEYQKEKYSEANEKLKNFDQMSENDLLSKKYKVFNLTVILRHITKENLYKYQRELKEMIDSIQKLRLNEFKVIFMNYL